MSFGGTLKKEDTYVWNSSKNVFEFGAMTNLDENKYNQWKMNFIYLIWIFILYYYFIILSYKNFIIYKFLRINLIYIIVSKNIFYLISVKNEIKNRG